MTSSKSILGRSITYAPMSMDLSHPADRRRIKIWSDTFNIPLKLTHPNTDDSTELLVLSSASKLSSLASKHKGPVIVDLVDGYLSGNTPFIEDFARNTIRSILGKSSVTSITFSNELRRAISRASAVVVSCPEQRQVIQHINKNVHCILDDHSEMKFPGNVRKSKATQEFTILWEGLGYTLKHLIFIADELQEFIVSSKAKMIVVTNPFFNRWSTSLGKVDSREIIRKKFGRASESIEFVEWSIESLRDAASRSDVAIIPIDLKDDFAAAKPENKLLSFWTMGVPTLCSPTPAYARVMLGTGNKDFLVSRNSWVEVLNGLKDKIKTDREFLTAKEYEFNRYLNEHHRREQLVAKWNHLIKSLMLVRI